MYRYIYNRYKSRMYENFPITLNQKFNQYNSGNDIS
jgi:hypothetical protein